MTHSRDHVFVAVVLLLALALPLPLSADPPAGYYDPALGLTGESLRLALHEIIDDHSRFPYTSSATDTWDIVSEADRDPGLPANVITIYRNSSVLSSDHNTPTGWNREHSWPSSYGFTNDGSCNYPYSDAHQLRASSPSYNSARSNRVFDWCISGCSEYTAEGVPFSNFGSGFGNNGSWQVWEDRRGDLARQMFYMETRYEGGTHGITGCSEPDLRLTDDRSLIISNTSANQSIAYMGVLETLLLWHLEDPVDAREQLRNDVIGSYQGNRNPYVDHPEWVCQIWTCSGADLTPPAAPSGLTANPGECQVLLDWLDNGEADLAGYSVYRSTSSGGPYDLIASVAAGTSNHSDGSGTVATPYFYVVSAVDTSGNESATGNEASAASQTGPACSPPDPGEIDLVISEVMANPQAVFDSAGEYFEIYNRGTATVDLAGWTIRDDDVDSQLIVAPGGLLIAPGEFLVLGNNSNSAQNGGHPTDYVYSAFFLANSVDEVVLGFTQGAAFVEVSRVNYTSSTFPYGAGVAMELIDLATIDTNTPVAWEAATETFGLGDFGTPGSGPVPPGPDADFIRGEVNLDGVIDISDPITILESLFGTMGPLPCADAGDVNDDGLINLSDVIFGLGVIFVGDPLPTEPYPLAGPDPTADSLGC